jgi:hypothetical protein
MPITRGAKGERQMALTPEQWAEMEKVFAAGRSAQAVRDVQHRMETGELEIELERGTDDPHENESTYQAELEKFKGPLNEAGIRYKQSAILCILTEPARRYA